MRLIVLLLALFSTLAAFAIDPVSERINSPPLAFYGLSTGTKEVNSVPVGSTFIETDTNKMYRWKGSITQGSASDWVELYQAVTLGTRLACESGLSQSLGICNAMPRCTTLNVIADTLAIKTGPGVLQTVIIDAAAAATDDFAIYDSLTEAGTVILKDTNAVGGAPFVGTNLGLSFSTGLTVGSNVWTSGASVTVCYL